MAGRQACCNTGNPNFDFRMMGIQMVSKVIVECIFTFGR